jgi:hypothetical protein
LTVSRGYPNNESNVKTVVLFLSTDSDAAQWKNKMQTRTLRKIGFIDNRYVGEARPLPGEYWMVEIIRENKSSKGGCLILHPIQKIRKEEGVPLLHGMYDMRTEDDIVVLVPHDKDKYWMLSPKAKDAILAATKANTIVIDHGGPMWTRRRSAEDVLEQEAKKILE